MRSLFLFCAVLGGCGGWPGVAPAPRNGLTAEGSEAYRALAHSLSNYMNARANHIEVNLELAAILEEVLLHARSIEDPDWREGLTLFERGFRGAKLPSSTSVPVTLEQNAPYQARWAAGEPLTGEPILDGLIRAYDIKVVSGRWLTAYELVVPYEVNRDALENQIARAAGILSPSPGWDPYAWGNGLQLGDSVVVRPDVCSQGWQLKISVGWGDCPAGCIFGRAYTFEIDTRGDTRLSSVTGSPIPAM